MKKRGETKRLLAFLLTLVMVFSNAGVVLAAESTEQGKDSVVVPYDGDADDTGDATDTDPTNAEKTSGSAIAVGTTDTSEFNEDKLDDASIGSENVTYDQLATSENGSETTGYVKIGSTIEYFDELPDVESESETVNKENSKKRKKAVVKAATQSMKFDGTVPDVEAPTSYTEVYERMMAMQELIPEETPWNDNLPYGDQGSLGAYYYWKGGNIDGKRPVQVGCAAFAAILSDGSFGNSPAKKVNRGSFTFEDVRVGDILRVNNNSHSVIVLQTNSAGVVIAEGNNGGKVHWGRTMSKQDVLYADFILTRYPEGFVSSDEEGANEVVDQGDEGNFHWTLTKSGILTISGSGVMPDFSPNDDNMPSWSNTQHQVSSVIIESGITSIGNYAFYQSPTLSVKISDSVTKIGDSAFYGSNIIEADIPASVKTIGNQAFRNCENLGMLNLNDGIETIGDRAFQDCINMSYILNIPASVTSVGESAFQSCGELMSVQFADSNKVVTLKDYAFCRCWKMLSIKLPNNLEMVSNGLFLGCTLLTYLKIPATVKEISTVDGYPTKSSPFASTAMAQIDFEGDESTWNSIGGNIALRDAQMLGKVVVNFNVSSTTNPDPENPNPENPNPENPNPENPNPENPNPENPNPENPSPENPNPENPDPENPNPENPNPENPNPENPDPENPNPENPNPENPDPENPSPENPSPENPDPENPSTPSTGDNTGSSSGSNVGTGSDSSLGNGNSSGSNVGTGSGSSLGNGSSSGSNAGMGSGSSSGGGSGAGTSSGSGAGTSSGWGSGSGTSTPSFPSIPSNSSNNSNTSTGNGNETVTDSGSGTENNSQTNIGSGNENVDNSGSKDKPKEAYEYAKKVKGHKLYDSNNKLVAKWGLSKKGKLIYKVYKGKKVKKVTKKNVVQVEYLENGNLVYHTTTRFVKEIDHVTLKTRTLYENAKKIVTQKGFATKVKLKNGKKKKIVSRF